MQFNKCLLVLLLLSICYKKVQAQEAWKKKFGSWINVELSERLKTEPLDSTFYIIPRFLWLRDLKELELVKRLEQKRKYRIKTANNKKIDFDAFHLFIVGDTILMTNNFNGNVVKFIRYR